MSFTGCIKILYKAYNKLENAYNLQLSETALGKNMYLPWNNPTNEQYCKTKMGNVKNFVVG